MSHTQRLPAAAGPAPARGGLPVDSSARDDFGVDAGGAPVWPTRHAGEMQALEALAAVFGALLRPVRGSPGRAEPDSEEVVAALGPEANEAARLYAHLTRRHFYPARDISQLKQAGPLAVLVTTPPWLCGDLLSTLYDELDPGPWAPGIVCAEPPALRRQVLARSAAAGLCGPLEARRIDVFPALEVSRFSLIDREVFGALADAADTRAALARGAGVLAVQTHSDGLDACLGPGLTVCPMNWMPLNAGRSRSSRCVETGFCHRHATSLPEALRSDWLMSPDDIRSRVLIWDVCWGILPANGLVDPAWGIGARLLANGAIGAVLTTWELSFPRPRLLDMVSSAVDAGRTVGEALYWFNRSSEARQAGQRMGLLGDPRVHLPPRPRDVSPAPTGSSERELHGPPFLSGDVEFLKLLLLTAAAHKSYDSPQVKEAAHKAGQAVGEYRPVESLPADTGPALRRAVLDYICRRGYYIIHSWAPYARIRKLEDAAARPCFACGDERNKLVTLAAEFDLPWIPSRRLSHCPCCGLVEDVPADTAIIMSVAGDREVRVSGDLPHAAWTARLLVSSKVKGEPVWWDWPSAGDGAPRASFRPSEPWPVGPVQVAFVLMHEARLILVAQLARGAKAAP